MEPQDASEGCRPDDDQAVRGVSGGEALRRDQLRLYDELTRNTLFYYEVNLAQSTIEGFCDLRSLLPGSELQGTRNQTGLAGMAGIIRLVVPEFRDDMVRVLSVENLRTQSEKGTSTLTKACRMDMPESGLRWIRVTVTFSKKPDTGESTAFLIFQDFDLEKKSSSRSKASSEAYSIASSSTSYRRRGPMSRKCARTGTRPRCPTRATSMAATSAGSPPAP